MKSPEMKVVGRGDIVYMGTPLSDFNRWSFLSSPLSLSNPSDGEW